MSASRGTKIFGMQLKVDPKILVGGLVVLAGVIFWFNSRGDDVETGAGGTTPRGEIAPVTPVPTAGKNKAARRNRLVTNDRGVLRIRPVDATRGDTDPTLRLDLLARLQSVQQPKPGRSLFEIGPSTTEIASIPSPPRKGPTIPVVTQPQPTGAITPAAPQVNIPLKFYGFVRPAGTGQTNRGLFLDGDNVLVASEGELIDQRYLIRELTAANARIEDTQIKQGQTLQVVPEATQQ